MANPTEIPSGTTSKQTLTNGETLDVAKGILFAYAKGAEAVDWTSGGTVTLDVEGQITASASGARGLDTDSTLSSGSSLTVNVASTGSIITADDTIRVDGNITSGSVNITNAGVIVSGTYNTATGVIGGTDTGQGIDLQNITSATTNVTITNQAGAVIGSGDSDAIHAGGTITVNNYGKIISQNDSNAAEGGKDDGVNLENSGGTVNNYSTGTIIGAHAGITGNVPAAGSTAITINNDGIITGQLGSGMNIDLPDGTTSTAGFTTTTVNNSATGVITGTAGVDSTGVSIDGDGVDVDGVVNILNAGTIQALGTSPGTLNEAITVGGGTIVNSGIIKSTQRGITVDNSNLQNAYAATTINNSGLIEGDNGQAISITDAFADTITNTATGKINGDILNGAGSDTLTNAGTITGNISFGLTSSTGITDGADTVTNTGTITGAVTFGSGNDIYNDYAGSTLTGTLDGGTGTDTLNLLGTGAGSFGNVVNFETLNVTSGQWTFTSTEAFTSTTIASGASLQIGNGGTAGSLSGAITDNGGLIADTSGTVNLSSAISGAGTLTVEGGGSLVLSAANAYSGGTTINGGTLEIAHADGAGTGAITMAAGNQTLVLDSAAFSNGNFANVIDGFGAGDKIDLAGVTNATSVNLGADNELLVSLGNGSTLTLHLDPSESFAGEYFHLGTDNNGGLYVTEDSQPCYCPGTLILTDRGEVSVEQLAIGDRLVTGSGAVRPIKWIGRRSYSGRFILGRADIQPICVKAGALGADLPKRDLWISPHHAMYLEGVLIEAHALVNDMSIVQPMDAADVSYFHIELDSHDIIVAEGALSESFIDDDSRMMFQNAHEYADLYGADVKPAIYCAPRMRDGAEVERARAVIAALAGIAAEAPHLLEQPRGFVDRIGGGLVEGWLMSPSRPDAVSHVDILIAGQVIGHAVAETYRRDLAAAGIGHGRYAFSFALPAEVDPSTVAVRCGRTAVTLPRAACVRLIDVLAA